MQHPHAGSEPASPPQTRLPDSQPCQSSHSQSCGMAPQSLSATLQDLLPPELSSPLRVGSSPMKAALLQSSAGSRGGSSSSLASAGQGQCRGDQAAAGAPAQDPLWGGAGLGGASEQPAASSGSLPGPSVLGTAEASPLAGAAVQETLQASPGTLWQALQECWCCQAWAARALRPVLSVAHRQRAQLIQRVVQGRVVALLCPWA